MTAYYYLTATLPYLSFGKEPPLAAGDFVAACGSWMTGRDMAVIEAAVSGENADTVSGKGMMGAWNTFDEELRGEIARAREGGKKREGGGFPERLKDILGEADPLAAEKKLEKARWDFIEDKAAGYYFDVNAIAAYGLKLRILERLATFDKDRGENFFYKVCEVKHEQAAGPHSGD